MPKIVDNGHGIALWKAVRDFRDSAEIYKRYAERLSPEVIKQAEAKVSMYQKPTPGYLGNELFNLVNSAYQIRASVGAAEQRFEYMFFYGLGHINTGDLTFLLEQYQRWLKEGQGFARQFNLWPAIIDHLDSAQKSHDRYFGRAIQEMEKEIQNRQTMEIEKERQQQVEKMEKEKQRQVEESDMQQFIEQALAAVAGLETSLAELKEQFALHAAKTEGHFNLQAEAIGQALEEFKEDFKRDLTQIKQELKEQKLTPQERMILKTRAEAGSFAEAVTALERDRDKMIAENPVQADAFRKYYGKKIDEFKRKL